MQACMGLAWLRSPKIAQPPGVSIKGKSPPLASMSLVPRRTHLPPAGWSRRTRRPGIGCAHGRGRSRASHTGPWGARPHNPMLSASTGGSPGVSMAKPRSSFWFALHFAMRSFAAASDGGATQLGSVAMRPGSISHCARVGRPSSRTPHQRRRPFLLHSVAQSRTKRWEDRQPSCFTCSRW